MPTAKTTFVTIQLESVYMAAMQDIGDFLAKINVRKTATGQTVQVKPESAADVYPDIGEEYVVIFAQGIAQETAVTK